MDCRGVARNWPRGRRRRASPRIARTRPGSVPRPATDLLPRLIFGEAGGFFFDDFLYFFGIERKTIAQTSYRSTVTPCQKAT